MYMLDQASLASAATGPPLSSHLALHQGELLEYSGGPLDDYETSRRLFWGTSVVHVEYEGWLNHVHVGSGFAN